MQYRGEKPLDEIKLYVFPPMHQSSLDFHEDDGITFKATTDDEYSITHIESVSTEDEVTITIEKAKGEYDGKPEARKWTLIVALNSAPKTVTGNGVMLREEDLLWNNDRNEIEICGLNRKISHYIIKIEL